MSEPTPTANDGEDENGTAVAAAPAAEDVSPPKVVEEEKIDELEEVRLPIEEEEEEEEKRTERRNPRTRTRTMTKETNLIPRAGLRLLAEEGNVAR